METTLIIVGVFVSFVIGYFVGVFTSGRGRDEIASECEAKIYKLQKELDIEISNYNSLLKASQLRDKEI